MQSSVDIESDGDIRTLTESVIQLSRMSFRASDLLREAPPMRLDHELRAHELTQLWRIVFLNRSSFLCRPNSSPETTSPISYEANVVSHPLLDRSSIRADA
jgi:hypothetical protein